MPDAKPKICVCIAADAALLHTSLLLITIDGADAVGGALSTTVEETVVFVSAAYNIEGNKDLFPPRLRISGDIQLHLP